MTWLKSRPKRPEIRVGRDRRGQKAKLELVHAKKGFKDELAQAQARAIRDFKKSEKFGTLLKQYKSGSCHCGLRLVHSFLWTKLPEALTPVVDELKAVNELANKLKLPASEVDEEEEDGDDVGSFD